MVKLCGEPHRGGTISDRFSRSNRALAVDVDLTDVEETQEPTAHNGLVVLSTRAAVSAPL
jgi:hypothetical protein